MLVVVAVQVWHHQFLAHKFFMLVVVLAVEMITLLVYPLLVVVRLALEMALVKKFLMMVDLVLQILVVAVEVAVALAV
jgi:hypothetical protein